MENKPPERILVVIEELKEAADELAVKKLDLDKCERVVKRVGSFSADCEDCQQYLLELEKELTSLKNKVDQLDEERFKQHSKIINNIVSHLQKEHKLVTEGYYLSTYLAFGPSIGLLLGLLLFDNIALGLVFGMGIGLSIGSSMDANAKNKGLTL